MLSFASRTALTLALVSSTASIAAAQSFTDLSYNSPVNPQYPTTEINSHDCRWDGQQIGPNYAGSTWSGFAALDLRDYLFSGGQNSWGRCFVNGRDYASEIYQGVTAGQSLTGYQQQYGSYNANSTNVVAIASETAYLRRNSAFTLESMMVGAGWGNVANLSITGWLGGSQVWVRNFSFLGTGGATEIFGMKGQIDEIRFAATYDEANYMDPYGSISEQLGYGLAEPTPYRTFFVDNITTSTVPEPATFSLVAVGLAGLVGVARRRRSR